MQIELLATDPAERAATLTLLAPRLPLRARDGGSAEPPQGEALWIHGDPPPFDPRTPNALRAWLSGGGRLLLTGPAARLCGVLCDEAALPDVVRSVWPRRVDAGDVRGVMALPRQPLFHRFPGGVNLTRARADAPRVEATWSSGRWPVAGRVLAVEKRLVGCDASRAVLVEHQVGRGRVLSLGVPLSFAVGDDEMDEPRARFLGDLFDYLASDHAAERSPCWPDPGAARGITVRHVGGGAAPVVAIPSEPVPEGDGLRRELAGAALAEDRFFDLIGRDGQAVYGRIRSGVDEVWGRSFRAFHDLRLSVAREGREPAPFGEGVEGAWVHPDEIGWRWRDGDATLLVRMCRAADGDGFAFVLRAEGPPVRVAVSARVDLRPSWPYPAGLVESIAVGTARAGASTTFGEGLVGARCALVLDRKPRRAWIRDASVPVVGDTGGAVAEFAREISIVSGDDAVVSFGGRLPAWEESGAVARAPKARAVYSGRAGLATGDAEIDRALALTIAKTADFVVPLDERNGGLVAGHGPSRAAPARFVACDALVCDYALLPLGERELARANLALCARFQDPNGRVHGAVTALGVVHHDSADSTAAFVESAARYLAWTGDVEFVRALWPAVERALAYLGRFDAEVVTDGVGAALVAQAWSAGAAIARESGDEEQAAQWTARAAEVRERTGVRPAGGARRVAGTAAAWLLGLDGEGRESGALRPFSTFAAQADWGTRTVADDDASRDPRSPGTAVVSPLLTGITALADLRWGRPESAWLRILPLLRSVEDFAPGILCAELRGDVYLPHEASAHRATSHAAVIGTFVEGICGLRLHDGRVALEPTLPGSLDRITFRDLSIRGSSLSGEVRREPDGRDVVVSLSLDGEPLELDVAPFVPGPVRIEGASRDGAALDVLAEQVGDGVRLRARVGLERGSTTLRFRAFPDLLLAVAPPRLEPGQSSRGVRFLGRRIAADGGSVSLDLECRQAIEIPIRVPGRPIVAVDGAELVVSDPIVLRIAAPNDGAAVTVTVRF